MDTSNYYCCKGNCPTIYEDILSGLSCCNICYENSTFIQSIYSIKVDLPHKPVRGNYLQFETCVFCQTPLYSIHKLNECYECTTYIDTIPCITEL